GNRVAFGQWKRAWIFGLKEHFETALGIVPRLFASAANLIQRGARLNARQDVDNICHEPSTVQPSSGATLLPSNSIERIVLAGPGSSECTWKLTSVEAAAAWSPANCCATPPAVPKYVPLWRSSSSSHRPAAGNGSPF